MGVVPQYNTLDRACTVAKTSISTASTSACPVLRRSSGPTSCWSSSVCTERADAYPQQLSGGLAQRLQIARAIAHRPKVLFLDEPSAGLDPQSRIAMWDAVRALRSEGITVVLTTHYMEEADELCDRVAIIDHGKILVEDTPAALKASVGGDKVYDLASLTSADREQSRAAVARARRRDRRRADGGRTARPRADARTVCCRRSITAANPYGLRDLTMTETSLETVFIRLTGPRSSRVEEDHDNGDSESMRRARKAMPRGPTRAPSSGSCCAISTSCAARSPFLIRVA